MSRRAITLFLGASLAASVFTGPASATTDITPPSAPTILSAFEYQFLELSFGYSLSTDNVTPKAAITYELYLDGVFESDIVPFIRPQFPNSSVAFAYAHAPGPVTLTLLAVDAAGNKSALSNAVTVTAIE
ncbi:hypothetical protein [Nonomuraea sp. NEAU-A123]|uniref:hypothetical protein n=1 Tax=Nonomuraea sp. NEAU-A123 TaxID=2839649 RepID=UPI001BE48582|nr:hypothetical protein [Nonomuraea sp. NEAU-A123]MBT2231600.1 hypothetical protein [Nonomuraea sp. NEAU-A123]